MKLNIKRTLLLILAMITGSITISNYIKIFGGLMYGTLTDIYTPVLYIAICSVVCLFAIAAIEDDLNKRK